jgi:HlyD family secretion protein
VRIRIKEKEAFRPGMSVTAEIETRYRTNALTVPIASVTTRVPKEKAPDTKATPGNGKSGTNTVALQTNASAPAFGSAMAAEAPKASATETNMAKADKKKEAPKPIEVVFVLDGDKVKMVPVKIGVSDDAHWEIVEGLQEGQEVISGGYRAISKDLEDGKKVRKGKVEDKKDDKEAP